MKGFVIITLAVLVTTTIGGPLQYTQDSSADVQDDQFIKCLATCMGTSLSEVKSWVQECQVDPKCWLEKVGEKAVDCIGKCMSPEFPLLQQYVFGELVQLKEEDAALGSRYRPESEIEVDVLNPVCQVQCLNMTPFNWFELALKCNSNVTCWKEFASTPKFQACVKNCSIDIGPYVEIVAKFAESEAQCMINSTANVKEWRAKCGSDLLCWGRVLEVQLWKCTKKCSPIPIPSIDLEEAVEFVVCDTKCMAHASSQIGKWFVKCGLNTSCWQMVLMGQAITCLNQCAPEQQGPIDLGLQSRNRPPSDSEEAIPSWLVDFLKCEAECLGKSLTEVEQWYQECQTDAKCWFRVIGLKGVECVGQCIPQEFDVLERAFTIGDSSISVGTKLDVLNPACQVQCLDMTFLQWFGVALKCNTNAACWKEFAATSKFQTCAKKCSVDIGPYIDMAVKFGKCEAQCLVNATVKVDDWKAQCGNNLTCWRDVLSAQLWDCTQKCSPIPIPHIDLQQVVQFVVCDANCMYNATSKIGHWFIQCGFNATCWQNAVGRQVVMCLNQCLPEEASPLENKIADQFLDASEMQAGDNRDPIGLCMSMCLHVSYVDVVTLFVKCKWDDECWTNSVGDRGPVCLSKCQKVPPPDQFTLCIESCLNRTYEDMIGLFLRCSTNATCWTEIFGTRYVECLDSCTIPQDAEAKLLMPAEQQILTFSKPDTDEALINCMADCLNISESDAERWFTQCGYNPICWSQTLRSPGLNCFQKCSRKPGDWVNFYESRHRL